MFHAIQVPVETKLVDPGIVFHPVHTVSGDRKSPDVAGYDGTHPLTSNVVLDPTYGDDGIAAQSTLLYAAPVDPMPQTRVPIYWERSAPASENFVRLMLPHHQPRSIWREWN